MTDTTKPDPLDGIMDLIQAHASASSASATSGYRHWTARAAACRRIQEEILSAIERAQADERERCAKVCEADGTIDSVICAQAIRARGTTGEQDEH
jgi:hypothetical protein